MITITKIFSFEMAHAIHNYVGACQNLHGHSYELHVTVTDSKSNDKPIEGLGIIIDFKDLKHVVNTAVIDLLDHRLVLSRDYLSSHPELNIPNNTFIWDYEPTAENILYFIKEAIKNNLPENVQLVKLKLYETKTSYAEWSA